MIGWTNMASGGVNIQNGKAVIHVLAPIGSTINFLKDGITIVLKPDKSFVDITKNNFAHWYYSISSSNYGEWTVTATRGTDTASDTVIIDSNKQYDLELPYTLWLVRNGVSLVQPILCYMNVVADPDFYILSSQSGVRGDGASWLIDSSANYTTITFVFSKNKSTILSGNNDRCGIGTGLVDGGNIATQNATYLAYSAILPLTNDLETRVVPVDNLQTQGNYAQVSVNTGAAAGSRVIAIKDIYLSR